MVIVSLNQNESNPLTTKNDNSTTSYQATSNDEDPSHVNYKIGSLDFERVINQHSIKAVRKRFYNANPSTQKDAVRDNSLSNQRKWLLGFT
jgi:macrodomain Ter protein organizer (MatP/YcbG family)